MSDSADKDAPEHVHYWHPVPAYRSVNGETDVCRCGATYGPGGRVTPPGVRPTRGGRSWGHGCTCGPDGTLAECAAELAAGGWCPRTEVVRAWLRSRVTPPGKDQT